MGLAENVPEPSPGNRTETQKQYLKLKLIHILLGKMDGGFENCLRLNGLRHEQREAQHGGGGGGDDGANPHPNLRFEYKTIQFDILGMSVSQKMMKLQNAWKICIFCNSECTKNFR